MLIVALLPYFTNHNYIINIIIPCVFFKQTNKQTDRQTDRQTDKHTNKQPLFVCLLCC